jgi:biotin carboxyl carrier protein
VLMDPVGTVPRSGKNWAARVNAEPVRVRFESELERQSARPAAAQGPAGSAVRAPLPGRVVKVSVKAGERIAAGAALLTIEAMKMENEIVAPRAGRVAKVLVEAGATVDADTELLVLEET